MNTIEQYFHFWEGPREAEPDKNFIYRNSGFATTRIVSWTKVVDNIYRLSVNECITEQKDPGCCLVMFLPERKSVSVFYQPLAPYTIPGDIFSDLFAGTFAVERSSMML